MASQRPERRHSKRYALIAPVVITWRTEPGERQSVQGLTRDICLDGMYVTAEKLPPRSIVVRCEVLLPQLDGNEGKAVAFTLQTVGRVVWTERNDTTGFGVSSRVTLLADAAA